MATMPPLPEATPQPTAILHPNGAFLIVPLGDREFCRRLEALIPAHARFRHDRQQGYLVIGAWQQQALALVGEWYPELQRHATPLSYDLRADDARAVLHRRAGVGR